MKIGGNRRLVCPKAKRTDAVNGGEAVKKEEKAKTITEDDAKDGLDEIQKLTDAKVKQIDELKAVKEKDVLEV